MSHAHCSSVLAAVRAQIAAALGARRAELSPPGGPPPRLLDVGCWDGEPTADYGAALGGAQLSGIEVFPEPAAAARARGITIAALDLERDAWPYADGSMDVVVCNQVLEHLKNIWLPLYELARVTRAGGTLVVSVPNLASLHNRVLLALGRQPTSIRIVGPHVRGYALRDFVALLEREGAWRVSEVVGVGFPPLPVGVAAPLARLWPAASHTPVVVCQRTSAPARRTSGDGDHQTFYGGA
jgi:SAM-dependent methyltransferase